MLGFIITLLLSYVYLMYTQNKYSNHMETSRLINEKMSSSKRPFKLDIEKYNSRNPGVISNFWNTHLYTELDWRRHMYEFVNQNKK